MSLNKLLIPFYITIFAQVKGIKTKQNAMGKTSQRDAKRHIEEEEETGQGRVQAI